jgi:hypothetical protein
LEDSQQPEWVIEGGEAMKTVASCARCGKEIKAGLLSGTRVWTPHVGEYKGKRIREVQYEIQLLLQERMKYETMAQLKDLPSSSEIQ